MKREAQLCALLITALFLLIFAPPSSSLAQTGITATQDRAEIQFPDSLTFSVELQSQAEIQQITLEYRVQQVTCGEVIAKAFPQFTPGKAVTATWTWEMKQSGSLPPGAKIYWLWQVTDAAGNTLTTQEQSITWLDNTHAWQTLSGKNVSLHWYNGTDTFGQELLDAAVAALSNLEQNTGLKPEKPIDLYIYASTDDLRAAILYEPGWAGGQAFSQHDIVIIGISAGQIDWGKGAIAHEPTHVLVGHLTFSCLGFVPGWLVEGLAMYGEGGFGSDASASISAMAQMWQQNLGVTITVENIEANLYNDKIFAGQHGQLFDYEWCADYPDPENFADALFHSEAQQNLGNYRNPKLDALLEQARVEQDVSRRIRLYQQAEQIIVNDAPALFTVHSMMYVLVKPYIQGYILTPIDISLERYLWIDPSKR